MIQTRWVRRKGTRQSPGVSLFTSLVAGFAILVAIVQMLVVTSASCEFAAFWVTGWFDFASNFQLASVAVGALAFLFLTRIMARFERSAAEAIMQGALIAALGAFMLALKAFLFPYAAPSAAQYAAIIDRLRPLPTLLAEEPAHAPERAEWPFDYPPPPMQDFYASPWRDSSINKPMQEIFKSAQSPTWAEYKKMQQCVGDYRAAIAQYEKDKAAYIKWEEGFREWTFAHPKEYEAQRRAAHPPAN